MGGGSCYSRISGGIFSLDHNWTKTIPGGIAAPALSVLFCVLLMSGLPILTWLRFFAWLAIGVTIHFMYSRHRSEFASKKLSTMAG